MAEHLDRRTWEGFSQLVGDVQAEDGIAKGAGLDQEHGPRWIGQDKLRYGAGHRHSGPKGH